MFAGDESGRIFIGHTGGIGGGKPGVGKTGFVRLYRGAAMWRPVAWRGHRDTPDALILGALDDPQLPGLVAAFVRETDRIKKKLTDDRSADESVPF